MANKFIHINSSQLPISPRGTIFCQGHQACKIRAFQKLQQPFLFVRKLGVEIIVGLRLGRIVYLLCLLLQLLDQPLFAQ